MLGQGQAINLKVYLCPQTDTELAPASCKAAGKKDVLPGLPCLASSRLPKVWLQTQSSSPPGSFCPAHPTTDTVYTFS